MWKRSITIGILVHEWSNQEGLVFDFRAINFMWLFIKRIILVKHYGYGIKSSPVLKWHMNAASWWLWNLIRASYHECVRYGELQLRWSEATTQEAHLICLLKSLIHRSALSEDSLTWGWCHSKVTALRITCENIIFIWMSSRVTDSVI